MRDHGTYFLCVTMVNMDRTIPAYIHSERTPPQLKTGELLKKLCDDGPDGCNEQCENWSVCGYGKEYAKREDKKIIRCACGCGQVIRPPVGDFHPRKFIKGHNYSKKGEINEQGKRENLRRCIPST